MTSFDKFTACLFLVWTAYLIADAQACDTKCEAYCNTQGLLEPEVYCSVENQTYCCGVEDYRYCCNDEDNKLDGDYSPVDSCPKSIKWYRQWKLIIGLLIAVIVLLLIAAFFYYCCGDPRSPTRAWQNRRRLRNNSAGVTGRSVLPTTASPGSEGQDNLGMTFDPQSQYAFNPPDYDSLPAEPPKYSDIFDEMGHSTGQLNAVSAEENAPEQPGNNNNNQNSSDQVQAADSSTDRQSEQSHASRATHDNLPRTADSSMTEISIDSVPSTTVNTSF